MGLAGGVEGDMVDILLYVYGIWKDISGCSVMVSTKSIAT